MERRVHGSTKYHLAEVRRLKMRSPLLLLVSLIATCPFAIGLKCYECRNVHSCADDGYGQEKECSSRQKCVKHVGPAQTIASRGCLDPDGDIGATAGCKNIRGHKICICETDLCNSSKSIRQEMEIMLAATVAAGYFANKMFH